MTRSRFHEMRRGADRGAVAVEFALIVIPLLALVLGIVQLGFAYNTQESLTQSARAGARQAAICGAACASPASIAAAAADNSPNLDASKLSVDVTYCPAGATQATGNAHVTISYPYSFLAAVTGSALTVTITGQATMPCGG
jgi:Flp pilus assembly protein TadG